MARSELNARFDTEERAFLKRFAQENGVSEAAALRVLVRRLMPQTIKVKLVQMESDPEPLRPVSVQVRQPLAEREVSPVERTRVSKKRGRRKGGK